MLVRMPYPRRLAIRTPFAKMGKFILFPDSFAVNVNRYNHHKTNERKEK